LQRSRILGSARLRLRKPLERAIGSGHPWVFAAAVDGERPTPGTVVTLLDRRGRFLARGLAEAGPIALRLLTTRDEPVDADLLARRIAEAFARRVAVVPAETDAYRLIHGEGDDLPGLVCDRYGTVAVLRLDGQAIEPWRAPTLAALRPQLAAVGVDTLLERSGRGASRRVVAHWGERPGEPVRIREAGAWLRADLLAGQKTGAFLDHRDSRRRLRELAAGARVLDLFACTGGFSIAAGLGGARRVVSVDVAAPALRLAELAWVDNGLAADRHAVVRSDVESFLAARQRDRYDIVVADPPSFAPRQSAVPRALVAYRALHRSALARLAPRGLYLAASCSSHVDAAAFADTLVRGARAAGGELEPLEHWSAPADHPSRPGFPEGDYLAVALGRWWPRRPLSSQRP
jgi:23S rRNA (cytosine1962-C5)-methyltransferase